MRILNQLLILLLACLVTGLAASRSRAQVAANPYQASATPSTAAAEDIARPPVDFAPYAVPQVVANPYTPTSRPHEPAEAKNRDQIDRTEHLRLAVEHLAAAGKNELAKQIASELLIETKLEQIRKLQAEVERLRGTPGAQQLMLHLKVIELQTTEMRKLGFDFQAVDGVPTDAAPSIALAKADAIDGLIEALRKDNLARVLAEPTLVTVSGRPASFQSGGEIPIIVPQSGGNAVVEYRQTGTRVDCVGTVLKTGRIRLELTSSISEVDPSRSIMLQEVSVPGLRTRRVDTAVEMDAGQTIVLCGMVQKCPAEESDSDANQEKTLLVAVTVHLVDPAASKEPALR